MNNRNPFVLEPKVEIEVTVKVLDDPGQTNQYKEDASDGEVQGDDELGDHHERRVSFLHYDLEDDIG